METVRFQADADLNQAIVTGVVRRQPDINFQTATEANLEGLKDLEVLALSAKQRRVLVTYDRRTMPTEFAKIHSQTSKAQVYSFFLEETALETVIEELILIWSTSTAEEWINRIAKVPL
jgi:hypothetical protein